MEKKIAPELALFFSECPKNSKYGSGNADTYQLRLCVIEEGERVRNISCSNWENPHIDLRDLAFACHVSWDRGVWNVYGWSVHYSDCWSVGQEQAEGMVRTFKRIARIKAKHIAKYGGPQTFSAFVQMLAIGLGIKRMVRVIGRDSNWHDKNEHQFLPIGELPGYIDHSLEEARRYHFPEAA